MAQPDLSARFDVALAAALPEWSRSSPLAALLGLELTEVTPGRCTLRANGERLRTAEGTIDGGVLAAAIDHAIAAVVRPLVGEGKQASPLEVKISHLGAPCGGAELIAAAEVLALGQKVGTVRVDVSIDGRRAATALGAVFVRDSSVPSV
jgi:uncharacterized protein (TIGR00369 family)